MSTVSMNLSIRKLAGVWIIGSLSILGLLIVQSLLGKYGDTTKAVWEWAAPALFPTLMLILGSLVRDLRGKPSGDIMIQKVVFDVARSISIFYLASVLVVILIQPATNRSPIDLMHMSELWLVLLQSLVTLILGAFFVSGVNE